MASFFIEVLHLLRIPKASAAAVCSDWLVFKTGHGASGLLQGSDISVSQLLKSCQLYYLCHQAPSSSATTDY